MFQTKFTTSDKDHVGDEYFLNSGDKIRYFLEEDSVDSNAKLTVSRERAVNKIGHGLSLVSSIVVDGAVTVVLSNSTS